MHRVRTRWILALTLTLLVAQHADAQPTAADAQRVFEAAAHVAGLDDGGRWGTGLAGPVILADASSRQVFASRPAPGFLAEGTIWSGMLPPGHGSIYGSMIITDEWGTLTVTGGGLVRSDWSGVVVPAPTDAGPPIQGKGYLLEMAQGWVLRATDDPTVWTAVRN